MDKIDFIEIDKPTPLEIETVVYLLRKTNEEFFPPQRRNYDDYTIHPRRKKKFILLAHKEGLILSLKDYQKLVNTSDEHIKYAILIDKYYININE